MHKQYGCTSVIYGYDKKERFKYLIKLQDYEYKNTILR